MVAPMPSSPWIKFYPSDWRSDPMLRMCSVAARGLWIEMLCIMHESGGYLLVNGKPLTPRQLAVLTGSSPDELKALMAELEEAGVYSRSDDGTIYSRRMLRDIEKADKDKEAGLRGGSPKLTGGYNAPGYVYLMGVRSDGSYKIGISTNPTNRLKKVRAQYPGQDIKVMQTWPVLDMSAEEAKAHQLFASKNNGGWFPLTGSDIETLDKTLKGPEPNGPLRGAHYRDHHRDPDGGPDQGPDLNGSGGDASSDLQGKSLIGPLRGPLKVRIQKPEARNQNKNSTDANASGAAAPADPRLDLFHRGLETLVAITGKPEPRARQQIGRWLKLAGDDAVVVMTAIEDAVENQVIDPSAWIEAALLRRGGGPPNRKPSAQDAAKALQEFVRETDDAQFSNIYPLLPAVGR